MSHARILLGELRDVLVVQVHPVSLGIFNFVNAWSMMFWPVMLADRKGQGVKQRLPLWLGTQAWLCDTPLHQTAPILPGNLGQCLSSSCFS